MVNTRLRTTKSILAQSAGPSWFVSAGLPGAAFASEESTSRLLLDRDAVGIDCTATGSSAAFSHVQLRTDHSFDINQAAAYIVAASTLASSDCCSCLDCSASSCRVGIRDLLGGYSF